MDLKEFASKICAENAFIKASFGGFAGSGKTRTASEFIIGCHKRMNIQKPMLFIDNEKGSRFLVPMFASAGIECYVKETVQLADVLAAFKMLNEGQVGFLFIDSLTKVWYRFVNDYKAKNRIQFMTLQDWGKILPSWQELFADAFVSLTGNCVFTGRGGYSYDMEETEENGKKKKAFVKSGVKMKMAGETPFEPDLNIWMEMQQDLDDNNKPVVWREAVIMKDRSGLIDGKSFKNPTYSDFSPVIDYLLSVDKGEVAKESNTTNLAPAEDYSSQNRRDKREILVEKNSNQFAMLGLSTGAEDKKMKILIARKIYGTDSWSEVEKMNPDKLEKSLSDLVEFCRGWETATDRKSYIENFQIPLL